MSDLLDPRGKNNILREWLGLCTTHSFLPLSSLLFTFWVFELSGWFWCQHEAGLWNIPTPILFKVPLIRCGFSSVHLAGWSGMLVYPGVQHGPSPLPAPSEWFPLFADNAWSYFCPVSVQFPLRLTWVSEIISPAKTDMDFGFVTDIFLRTRSELVRFMLSIFVIALWPGMNPRNFPRNLWRAFHKREVIESLSTYMSSVVLLQFFYNHLRFLCNISSVCNGKKFKSNKN